MVFAYRRSFCSGLGGLGGGGFVFWGLLFAD